MRRVVNLFRRRRAWLTVCGFIGAPFSVMLAFSLPSPISTETSPENAEQRGHLVVRHNAPVPRGEDEVSPPRADDERSSPDQPADVTVATPAPVSPAIEPESTTPRLEDLVTRFRKNCADCHGDDGTGNVVRMQLPAIPDFTNLAWQVSQTEVAIVNQVADGTVPLMPSFRDKLSPRQMLELAVYVRTFTGRLTVDAEISRARPRTSGAAPEDIFQTHCVECHHGNGRGNDTMRTATHDLPDFTSSRWQKSRSDAEIAHSIQEGKGTMMLPMKDKLGSVDVREMVALIRAFEGGQQSIAVEGPDAPDPEARVSIANAPEEPGRLPAATLPEAAPGEGPRPPPTADIAARIRVGAGLFRQYCIACHGADGTGSPLRAQMPPIPDFTNSTWQVRHTDPKLVVSIMDGKGTLMPANRVRLTDAQARDLVAYLRSFGPRKLRKKGPVSKSEFEKSFRELEQRWNEIEKGLEQNEPPKKEK